MFSSRNAEDPPNDVMAQAYRDVTRTAWYAAGERERQQTRCGRFSRNGRAPDRRTRDSHTGKISSGAARVQDRGSSNLDLVDPLFFKHATAGSGKSSFRQFHSLGTALG